MLSKQNTVETKSSIKTILPLDSWKKPLERKYSWKKIILKKYFWNTFFLEENPLDEMFLKKDLLDRKSAWKKYILEKNLLERKSCWKKIFSQEIFFKKILSKETEIEIALYRM